MRNLLLLLLLPFFGYSQTTYYFQGGNLNAALSWNDNQGGGGTPATGFTNSNDIFDLNGKSPSTFVTNETIAGQLTNSSATKATIRIGTLETLIVSGTIPSVNNIEINIMVANSKLILSHSGDSNIPEITGNGILEISGAGTKTATASINAHSLILNSTLDMETHQLTGVTGVTNNSSFVTLLSSCTSGLPFPEGLTFPIDFDVVLYAGADQEIPCGDASYSYLSLTGNSTKTISSGKVTIQTAPIAFGLAINPSTALVVPSGMTLDVSGADVILSASASQYAQLLVQGTFTANGSTTVEKEYDLDLSSARWFHRGIGVTGANLDSLPAENGSLVSSSGPNGSIWFWNANNSKWTNPPSLTNNDPKIGYTIFAGNEGGTNFLRVGSGIVKAEGTGVATGTINIPLAYHDGTGGDPLFVGGASGYGWNLIANPYTATYDWDGQTLPSSTSSAVYVWNGTNYSSYVGGSGTNGGSRYIAPGQAFWVQTTATPGGTLDLLPSKLTVAEPVFLKTNLDYVHLQLKKASGQQLDEIAVGFNAAATNGFDGSFDAHKLPNSVGTPNLSADFGNQPLSISRAPSTTTDFPVRLESNGGPQNLMFTIDQTELGSFTTVHIEDLHTGTTVELSNGGSYSFVHTDMDIEDRFVLKFSGSTIGIEEEVLENQVSMSIVDNELFIFNHSDALSLDAVLLDIQGRIITTFETSIASPRTSILLPNLSSGVYIVRYKTNVGHHGLQRISKY